VNKPVNYDELFPGRFIKADLFVSEFGTDKPTVTIKGVDLETFPRDDGKEETRGVLTLGETAKQMKLNRTNGDCLKAMFGTSVQNDWLGKRITLCIERDRDPGGVKGAMCNCIRVFGSPDIAGDVIATIKLPKRKPKDRRLVRTGQAKQPATPAAPAPEKRPGNLQIALESIATATDVEPVKIALGAFSWTREERQEIGAAIVKKQAEGSAQ